MSGLRFVFLVAVAVLVLTLDYSAESRRLSSDLPAQAVDLNGSKCQDTCNPVALPPASGGSGSLYGVSPPPPPFPGYPTYVYPPALPSQPNCTQVPVQCCVYPPPPPYPMGYQPIDNHTASSSPSYIFAFIEFLLATFAILL